ncbi:MAG: DEAD/DEAH box helicase [Planctomycetaceae bacterium]|nr:DEAD/DEAH box helicase [Planctomycetaceae bacterium]
MCGARSNGGKSLVGLLVLLDAVQHGGRAVLLEPLRALAREKADELQRISKVVSAAIGTTFSVQISTGDYRLSDELMTDRPPDAPQLIVATPESFDAILRNPEYSDWVSTIRAVCVDEAHLISSPRRGPTLEYVVTTLLSLNAPPRIALLSASMGEFSEAQQWLSPCEVLSVTDRVPSLRKHVAAVGADEDVNTIVIDAVAEQLKHNPDASVLVFVYRTDSAESLANALSQSFSSVCPGERATAYHSRMSAEGRERIRQSFLAKQCRCVVTTTALAMGVNLPATHVIVRDVTFPGAGRLPINDILQMIGRAGRGNCTGTSLIVCRENDPWDLAELSQAVRQEPKPHLVSALCRPSSRPEATDSAETIASLVANLLSRSRESGLTESEIRNFFEHSLGRK